MSQPRQDGLIIQKLDNISLSRTYSVPALEIIDTDEVDLTFYAPDPTNAVAIVETALPTEISARKIPTPRDPSSQADMAKETHTGLTVEFTGSADLSDWIMAVRRVTPRETVINIKDVTVQSQAYTIIENNINKIYRILQDIANTTDRSLSVVNETETATINANRKSPSLVFSGGELRVMVSDANGNLHLVGGDSNIFSTLFGFTAATAQSLVSRIDDLTERTETAARGLPRNADGTGKPSNDPDLVVKGAQQHAEDAKGSADSASDDADDAFNYAYGERQDPDDPTSNVVVEGAEQFRDQSAASAANALRAVNNLVFRDPEPVSASKTLTADDNGKFLNVDLSMGDITLTLPNIDDLDIVDPITDPTTQIAGYSVAVAISKIGTGNHTLTIETTAQANRDTINALRTPNQHTFDFPTHIGVAYEIYADDTDAEPDDWHIVSSNAVADAINARESRDDAEGFAVDARDSADDARKSAFGERIDPEDPTSDVITDGAQQFKQESVDILEDVKAVKNQIDQAGTDAGVQEEVVWNHPLLRNADGSFKSPVSGSTIIRLHNPDDPDPANPTYAGTDRNSVSYHLNNHETGITTAEYNEYIFVFGYLDSRSDAAKAESRVVVIDGYANSIWLNQARIRIDGKQIERIIGGSQPDYPFNANFSRANNRRYGCDVLLRNINNSLAILLRNSYLRVFNNSGTVSLNTTEAGLVLLQIIGVKYLAQRGLSSEDAEFYKTRDHSKWAYQYFSETRIAGDYGVGPDRPKAQRDAIRAIRLNNFSQITAKWKSLNDPTNDNSYRTSNNREISAALNFIGDDAALDVSGDPDEHHNVLRLRRGGSDHSNIFDPMSLLRIPLVPDNSQALLDAGFPIGRDSNGGEANAPIRGYLPAPKNSFRTDFPAVVQIVGKLKGTVDLRTSNNAGGFTNQNASGRVNNLLVGLYTNHMRLDSREMIPDPNNPNNMIPNPTFGEVVIAFTTRRWTTYRVAHLETLDVNLGEFLSETIFEDVIRPANGASETQYKALLQQFQQSIVGVSYDLVMSSYTANSTFRWSNRTFADGFPLDVTANPRLASIYPARPDDPNSPIGIQFNSLQEDIPAGRSMPFRKRDCTITDPYFINYFIKHDQDAPSIMLNEGTPQEHTDTTNAVQVVKSLPAVPENFPMDKTVLDLSTGLHNRVDTIHEFERHASLFRLARLGYTQRGEQGYLIAWSIPHTIIAGVYGETIFNPQTLLRTGEYAPSMSYVRWRELPGETDLSVPRQRELEVDFPEEVFLEIKRDRLVDQSESARNAVEHEFGVDKVTAVFSSFTGESDPVVTETATFLLDTTRSNFIRYNILYRTFSKMTTDDADTVNPSADPEFRKLKAMVGQKVRCTLYYGDSTDAADRIYSREADAKVWHEINPQNITANRQEIESNDAKIETNAFNILNAEALVAALEANIFGLDVSPMLDNLRLFTSQTAGGDRFETRELIASHDYEKRIVDICLGRKAIGERSGQTLACILNVSGTADIFIQKLQALRTSGFLAGLQLTLEIVRPDVANTVLHRFTPTVGINPTLGNYNEVAGCDSGGSCDTTAIASLSTVSSFTPIDLTASIDLANQNLRVGDTIQMIARFWTDNGLAAAEFRFSNINFQIASIP